MQAQQFPDLEFRRLNELVSAYCAKNSDVRQFFQNEAELAEIAKAAQVRNFPTSHYAVLSEVLREQYQNNIYVAEVEESLASFDAGNAITVTTGHQLCLLGGPAYFIYKILSTIKLAQRLQPLVTERKVVPVFWLAGEDHDVEEINHTFINGTSLKWNTEQTGPVGRFSLYGFERVFQEWIDTIDDESLRNTIGTIWNRAMQCDTWAELTKSWVHECFGEWGLVVINADNPRLKQLFAPAMKRELMEGVAHKCVSASNDILLKRGYHVQVNPREINLFYLGAQSRVRIERGMQSWQTVDNRRTWNESDLLDELERFPENFSPNVLLRPLYQETILPNVAYVGGPGELAYWLQLNELFRAFEIPMPALVLRDSAMLVSQAANKRLTKLGLTIGDLVRDKKDLVAALVGYKPDFAAEKEEILRVYEKLAERISEVDSTLRATTMAEAQRVLSGVEQLQAKTWKAIKVKEEQKLAALDKVWEELFPHNNWQERSQNILIESMANNKELMRLLLNEFQPPVSTLVLIEL
jgi:bacillithiol biosynthesis cysteine-adding enzyme BshC